MEVGPQSILRVFEETVTVEGKSQGDFFFREDLIRLGFQDRDFGGKRFKLGGKLGNFGGRGADLETFGSRDCGSSATSTQPYHQAETEAAVPERTP
jgi:hypothetical protein